MATIKKTATKNGETRYQVRVVTGYNAAGDPKQAMRTFRTKKEADAWGRAEELRIDQGLGGNAGRITVRDFLDQWLARWAKRVRPVTLAGYSAILARYVYPRLSGLLLRDATPAAWQRLLDDMPTAFVTGHCRRILHVAFEDATRLGMVPFNPLDRTTAPPHQTRQGTAWTEEEARRFLVVARDDGYQPYWTLALCTGMRPSELLGLTWEALDLGAGTLAIREARATYGDVAFAGKPKSQAGKRALILPPSVITLLRARRAAQHAQRLALGELWTDHNLVCPSAIGTHLELRNIAHRFRALIDQAGVRRIRPYDLRHTAISLMLAGGADLKATSEVVGHSDPRLTARVYQHAYEGQRTKALADLAGSLLDGDLPLPGEAARQG
ncbi:MAG TPA: tyrosine-type recombinase/integrase [Chloroflexota bacterium]|nr:tyrosine-type recombinase/integrase [Chloroflexota bacterium]